MNSLPLCGVNNSLNRDYSKIKNAAYCSVFFAKPIEAGLTIVMEIENE